MAFLRKCRSLICFLLIASAAYAQTSRPQITGHVIRADTGTPIQGATIQLIPPFIAGARNLQTAVTNSEGKYEFRGVQPGVYTVEASAKGFAPQTYKPGPDIESEFQKITTAPRLLDIDFQLSPEVVISGFIRRMTGDPVEAGLEVAAVRRDKREDGSERLLPVVETKTDAQGAFVLNQLPSGTYLVCVNGPNGYDSFPVNGTWYRETWYGDGHSADEAIAVTLRDGEQKSDLVITTMPERRFQVTVWPTGPEGVPTLDRYDVDIMGRSQQYSGNPDKGYLIPGIPPGHYTLVTTAWSGVKYVGQSDTTFSITNRDVVLYVTVGGLGEVSGVATFDKSAPVPDGFKIRINSLEGASNPANVDKAGRFSFTRVLPGRYQFALLPINTTARLLAAQCNGSKVTPDAPLVVRDRETVTGCELKISAAPTTRSQSQ